MGAEPAARQHAPLRRNRDFQLLWGGQAVSLLGSQTSKIAYPLLVLAMTGSPAKAGIAGFAAMLGYLLFPLPAGGLVDRHDRKRIMIGCDAIRLLAVGSIAVAGWAAHITYVQALSPAAAITVVAAGMAVTALAATVVAPVRDAGRRTPGAPGAAADAAGAAPAAG